MTVAEHEPPDAQSDRPPTTFHVADCLTDCPPAWFLGKHARDEWAVRHEDKTGHEVGVRTEHVGSGLPVAQSALVIRPGDRVLLTVGGGHKADECIALRDRLSERFPDVQWTVAAGVTAVIKVET